MRKKFEVGEPQVQLASILKQVSKYKIGEKGFDFYAIRELKPTFAFDYISLLGQDYCYNQNGLSSEDYVGLITALKTISGKTYKELREVKNYRFHPIDFDDQRVQISRKNFKLALVPREELLSDDQLPTLYQFDLHYAGEARACGFLFKGVFYLVWFDRHHKIYG